MLAKNTKDKWLPFWDGPMGLQPQRTLWTSLVSLLREAFDSKKKIQGWVKLSKPRAHKDKKGYAYKQVIWSGRIWGQTWTALSAGHQECWCCLVSFCLPVNVNQISEMLKDTELMLSLAKELHAGKKQTDWNRVQNYMENLRVVEAIANTQFWTSWIMSVSEVFTCIHFVMGNRNTRTIPVSAPNI